MIQMEREKLNLSEKDAFDGFLEDCSDNNDDPSFMQGIKGGFLEVCRWTKYGNKEVIF